MVESVIENNKLPEDKVTKEKSKKKEEEADDDLVSFFKCNSWLFS